MVWCEAHVGILHFEDRERCSLRTGETIDFQNISSAHCNIKVAAITTASRSLIRTSPHVFNIAKSGYIPDKRPGQASFLRKPSNASPCRPTTRTMSRLVILRHFAKHVVLIYKQGQFFPFFILTISALVTLPLTYSLLKPSKG